MNKGFARGYPNADDSAPDILLPSGIPVSTASSESLSNLAVFSPAPGTPLFDRFRVIRSLSNVGSVPVDRAGGPILSPSGQSEPVVRSSQGTVLLCNELLRPEKLVALKVARAAGQRSDLFCLGLEREFAVARMVDHPNVLLGNEFFHDDNHVGYSMEYLSGGTLADILLRGALPFSRVFSLLVQLAQGLESVHEAQIVHRDLTPDNILLGLNDTLKIADFGIAVVPGLPNHTCSSRLVGTVDYLAPEYVEFGVSNQASDIFALGVIGYEMITGRLPFDGEDLVERLSARVTVQPNPPHTLRAGCPRPLSELIMTALARDPNQRFTDVAELRAHLQAVAVRFAVTADGLAREIEACQEGAGAVFESDNAGMRRSGLGAFVRATG